MFAMAEPKMASVVKAIPNKMLLSTAISLRDGGLAWRGDWPLADVSKIAKAVFELMREEALQEELEEEFD
jgi:hypothetical protein